MNHELPDVQARFRKGRETRDQIANIRWVIKKAREFQKICMQVRKQQLELNPNYRLVPNRKRSMSRLYIVTLLI